MRISDWSADVCAADLVAAVDLLPESEATAHVEVGETRKAWLQRGEALGGRFAPRKQIGSASCRERVCPYVSISVVAVSLKTNTPTSLDRNKKHTIIAHAVHPSNKRRYRRERQR